MWLACLLSVLLAIVALCQLAILLLFFSSRDFQVGEIENIFIDIFVQIVASEENVLNEHDRFLIFNA